MGKCLLLAMGLVLTHQVFGERMRRSLFLTQQSGTQSLESKMAWFWDKVSTPLAKGLDWLGLPNATDIASNGTFDGIAFKLDLQVDKDRNIKLYSLTEDSRPAKCMTLSVTPKHNSMHVGWIGSENPDNPCLFSMKMLLAWIEEVYKWGQVNGYTRFGCTDMARGTCEYKVAADDGTHTISKFPHQWILGSHMMPERYWQGRVFQFTPMSLVKYGMPFYTKTTGVFPYQILKAAKGPARTAAAHEFCHNSKRAKDLGGMQLKQLLSEVDPKAVPIFQSAMDMMHKGAGAEDSDTLANLLMDKSIWTSVRDTEDECQNLGKLSAFLSSWPCKAGQDNEAACQDHRELSLWMKSLVNLQYDRSMIDVDNDELACDFYDTTWKLAFHSRWGPYVRKFLKAGNYLAGLR